MKAHHAIIRGVVSTVEFADKQGHETFLHHIYKVTSAPVTFASYTPWPAFTWFQNRLHEVRAGEVDGL